MDAEGVEGFFHGCEAFRRDDVGARDEKMGGRADLFPFNGIVPEAALPALTIDDRELNRRGEAFEVFVEGEGLEELLGVRGAVGSRRSTRPDRCSNCSSAARSSSRDPQQTQSPFSVVTSSMTPRNLSASIRAF